ncbi:hypothetical protein AAF712_004636 [Marasmius tenuissimus]|uniref:F-box domain-containing protein n=1 Tax=Marasmius tenuissimus TaxID=585030 RepID=A0ABR3A4H2_9AGAR
MPSLPIQGERSHAKASGLEKDLRQKLEAWDGRILQLENELRTAHLERTRLQRALDTLPNCDGVWSKIPNELLAEIFQRSVDADTRGHSLSSQAMPWVLAQVCGRWREIVVSTPMLWVTIRVHTRHLCRQPYQMVQTWLERSLPLPISCLVIFVNGDLYRTEETILFNLLLKSCGRWRHLHIHFRDRSDLYPKLFTNEQPTLQLESIWISSRIPYMLHYRGQPHAFGRNSPKLLDASINISLPLESLDQRLSLPSAWEELQTLEWILHTSLHDFLHAVSVLPHLRTLSLTLRDSTTWDGSRANSTFTLSALRRLELSGQVDSIERVMGLLHVPNLTDLSILNSPVERPSALQSLAGMLDRSSCCLIRFNTSFKTFAAFGSTGLYAAFSTIEEFHIRLNSRVSARQIVNIFEATGVLPRLRALHLVVFTVAEVLPEQLLQDLVNVVKARARRGGMDSEESRLTLLSIDTATYAGVPKPKPRVNTPAFQQLLRLREEGLEVLGNVVEGRWNSTYQASTHWSFEEDERRWSRFGYSDWLCSS